MDVDGSRKSHKAGESIGCTVEEHRLPRVDSATEVEALPMLC